MKVFSRKKYINFCKRYNIKYENRSWHNDIDGQPVNDMGICASKKNKKCTYYVMDDWCKDE